MSSRVLVRPLAEADLGEIYADLSALDSKLASLFADRLREALEQLEAWPESGGRVWKKIRALRVRKFRYVVYYFLNGEIADVIAVLHGARNPRLWKSRAD